MYRMSVCRWQSQNLDNLLCLRPVVLFTKDFAYPSCRTLTKLESMDLDLLEDSAGQPKPNAQAGDWLNLVFASKVSRGRSKSSSRKFSESYSGGRDECDGHVLVLTVLNVSSAE